MLKDVVNGVRAPSCVAVGPVCEDSCVMVAHQAENVPDLLPRLAENPERARSHLQREADGVSLIEPVTVGKVTVTAVRVMLRRRLRTDLRAGQPLAASVILVPSAVVPLGSAGGEPERLFFSVGSIESR